MELQELKNKMERVKIDLGKKEGEKEAILCDLKENFGVKSIDEAYDKFDELDKKVEEMKKEKEKLVSEIDEKLKGYGY